MALVVCGGCNRHVREDTCPFCGARVDRERGDRGTTPRSIGHATRAMIAFGAAAATASAASITACGGDTKSNASNASQEDASPMDAATMHSDASFMMADVANAPSYGIACPDAVDTSQIPQWKAPVASPAACGQSDLSTLKAEIANANATFNDVYNALGSDACKRCVFSDQASANWQLFVWVPDMKTGMGDAFVNYGACFATAAGGSAACGKAEQDDQSCLQMACPSPSCDGTDRGQSCISSSQMGACKQFSDSMMGSCGGQKPNLDAECKDLLAMMDVLCVTGPGDGGSSDSGTD